MKSFPIQHDNCNIDKAMVLIFDRIMRAHTARLTQSFLQTNGINALAMDWPVMSDDLESDREFQGRAEETSAQSPASVLELARTWESVIGRVAKYPSKDHTCIQSGSQSMTRQHSRVNTHVNKKVNVNKKKKNILRNNEKNAFLTWHCLIPFSLQPFFFLNKMIFKMITEHLTL